MTVHPTTINLPPDVYRRLQHRAQINQRTLEAEIIEILTSALDAFQPSELAMTPKAKTSEEPGWPLGFFEATAGSIPDFPDCESEGDFEVREKLDDVLG